MRPGVHAVRHRALAVLAAAAGPAAGALAVAAPAATPVRPVVARDAVDTPGGLDLTRVQLGRAADGRLRATLTLAAPWRMRDLPAADGPPGSLCLRMWTRAKPGATFPDYLLCMTADEGGRHMTGSILIERDGALQRLAFASLRRSSARTIVARFSPVAIGGPRVVRFAAEATTPGCARPACVDTAPNAPAVATLRLRSS